MSNSASARTQGSVPRGRSIVSLYSLRAFSEHTRSTSFPPSTPSWSQKASRPRRTWPFQTDWKRSPPSRLSAEFGKFDDLRLRWYPREYLARADRRYRELRRVAR